MKENQYIHGIMVCGACNSKESKENHKRFEQNYQRRTRHSYYIATRFPADFCRGAVGGENYVQLSRLP